ncbi:MAG: hypothetical protein JST51_01610 [Armatimonadetes bacterium]|nr:hypothetical protein [Armatimonadota bacterium]
MMPSKPVLHSLRRDTRWDLTKSQVKGLLLTTLVIGLVLGYCLARAQEERRHYLHTTYPDLYGREDGR